MKICVIGSGPAGVMAAWAAARDGHRVTVLHPKGKLRSEIHGAQYVHAKIMGVPRSIQDFRLRYVHVGSEEAYRQKIYGDKVPPGGTSWGLYGPVEIAWSMPEIYSFLLDELPEMGVSFVAETVTPENIDVLTNEFAYVLSTAPLRSLAPEAKYVSETVYVGSEIPRGMRSEFVGEYGDNVIAYLGVQGGPYRASIINGVASVEYSEGEYQKANWFVRRRLTKVVKPVRATGVDLPGVYLLGRYGRWSKGQLAHHAYEDALRIIRGRLSWQATQQM